MKAYPAESYTWGCELEIGDVPKKHPIPKHLGSWEYSETDVLNLRPPYRGIAADPNGISPPVGGEVNMRPSLTWRDQVDRIQELLADFRSAGHDPTTSFVSHTHVHVHVPGLVDDIDALHRLTRYVQQNQSDIVSGAGQYQDHPDISKGKGAKQYFKYDGGRQIPDWMAENLLKTSNFKDFITMHCMGKDGVSRGRPLRYAINMYCLKHTKTIEMRFFRASLERSHLESCFEFTEAFVNAALNNGPSAKEILASKDWDFPPFDFDLALWKSHQDTKHKSGGPKGKNRAFWIAS